YPAVREAVAVVREDQPGNKRLVAYLVSHLAIETGRFSISQLRRFLQEKLPDYMVPSAFVMLDLLPLTPNGKIDRRALPAPDTSHLELEEAYAPPMNSKESILAEAWAKVLCLEKVGVHDNFFALGGDSILSIQMRAIVQSRKWGFELKDLFQYPTIRELARHLTSEEQGSQITYSRFCLLSREDRELITGDIEDAYPLISMQSGMLYHTELSPDSAVYHNVSALLVRARFDEPSLNAALKELARRHQVLRTSFDLTHYSRPLQLVHREVEIPFLVDNLSALTPQEQDQFRARWFEDE